MTMHSWTGRYQWLLHVFLLTSFVVVSVHHHHHLLHKPCHVNLNNFICNHFAFSITPIQANIGVRKNAKWLQIKLFKLTETTTLQTSHCKHHKICTIIWMLFIFTDTVTKWNSDSNAVSCIYWVFVNRCDKYLHSPLTLHDGEDVFVFRKVTTQIFYMEKREKIRSILQLATWQMRRKKVVKMLRVKQTKNNTTRRTHNMNCHLGRNPQSLHDQCFKQSVVNPHYQRQTTPMSLQANLPQTGKQHQMHYL